MSSEPKAKANKNLTFTPQPDRQSVIDNINDRLMKHFPNVPFAQVCGFFSDLMKYLEQNEIIPKKK